MNTKHFFVVGLLTAGLFSATSSGEPCRNWDARGFWMLNAQTSKVEMHLDQSGNTITGRATCNGAGGNVVGTLGGASLNFQITWSTGGVSSYTGTIAPDGRIGGSWYPADRTKYTWSGDRAMRCKDSAPAASTASAPQANTNPPKRVVTTGHPKPVGVLPGTTADTSGNGGFVKMIPTTSGPQARTPLIKANPQEVTIPNGQSEGTAVLIWDAGNDHPSAEVWLRVNGHEKKLFAQTNKGRREVVVQPGKSYLYILTDSGQKLATVTVQAGQQGSMDRHPNGGKHKHRRDDDSEN
jgi:hypothetical protein